MYKLLQRFSVIGMLFFYCQVNSYGQPADQVKGVLLTGESGLPFTMGELQQLSDAKRISRKLKTREEQKVHRHLLNHAAAPFTSSFPGTSHTLFDLETTQPVHSNFQGISLSESGAVPPDCMGDLSETQICIAANGRIKFYAKPTLCNAPVTTSTTAGSNSLINPQFSIDMDVFFNAVRNNQPTTDPQVYFDRLSKRWFVVAINVVNKSNRMMIAVSNSAMVTAGTSFTFYYFTHDQGTVSGDFDHQQFGDFPMVGLDKHALYIGALIFDADNDSYQGSSCYVVRKSSLISGGPIVFTAFRRVGGANTGIFGPNPALNDDPQATVGYFVGVNSGNFGLLNYVIIKDPGGTPTSTIGSLTVPATSTPISQVAKGSNKPLDAGDDRLLNVQLIKNKITGQNTIWTAHNIAVNAAGVAATDGNGLRNAIRWYELNATVTALTLKQSGTWYDNAATAPQGYWMGSIAVSGQGHALAGASAAGANNAANVVIAGRYNSQTLGQLSNTVFATNYNNVYNAENDNEQRWGDYSQTVVDPSDNMTIWTFQEYTNATNSWGERAVQVKAPPPATPVGMTPIICNDLRITQVALTGKSVSNSGFFDPGPDAGGPGFSKHLQVTSTGNVSISDVVFNSPTEIRFVIDYSAALPGSQQTLTVTNPDCQSVNYSYKIPAGCDSQSVAKPMYVYPNPATGVIKVFLTGNSGTIRLLDIAGKLIKTEIVNSNFISIPAAALAKGVYVIEYLNGNTRVSEKVLLE